MRWLSAGEYIRVERLRGGKWGRFGERDGGGDLALDLVVERGAPRRRQHGADLRDLVVVEPRDEIGTVAVAGVEILVRSDMLAPAIGAALDEGRSLAAADARDQIGRERAQRQH